MRYEHLGACIEPRRDRQGRPAVETAGRIAFGCGFRPLGALRFPWPRPWAPAPAGWPRDAAALRME